MSLGWPSVEWGLAHISSQELAEWQAYEMVCGPLEPTRSDYHAAKLLWMIANLMRGKDQEAYPMTDFMPKWDTSAHSPSPTQSEGMAAFEAMYAAMQTNAE